MEVTKEQFVMSYGVAVGAASKLFALVSDKSYLGLDGKLGPEDLMSLMPQIMMLMGSAEHFKLVAGNTEMFLDPAIKPQLQAAFATNFDMADDSKEKFIEEIHDIVLGVIKLIIKLK